VSRPMDLGGVEAEETTNSSQTRGKNFLARASVAKAIGEGEHSGAKNRTKGNIADTHQNGRKRKTNRDLSQQHGGEILEVQFMEQHCLD